MKAAISVIKRTMIIAAALLFALTNAGAQTGTWSGKLDIQGQNCQSSSILTTISRLHSQPRRNGSQRCRDTDQPKQNRT